MIKVTARHERDDRDIELDYEQVRQEEIDLNVTPNRLAQMYEGGVRQIIKEDGWTLTLSEG